MNFQRHLLGDLDATVAADVLATSGDVAMLIDRDGMVCDVAVNGQELALDGAGAWRDQRWLDTVTADSRSKAADLLQDARTGAAARWREVQHPSARGDLVTVKYLAFGTGRDGKVIAIGRDDRAAAALQARLMQAQQSMERGYARLREAEARYRLLFQISAEGVLIVEAGSRKILEANPAAEAMIGAQPIGKAFAALFDATSRDPAASLLAVVHSTSRTTGGQARLDLNGREFAVAASLFRQDRSEYFLVRLSALEPNQQTAPESDARLLALLERLPDAFVVTDPALNILAQNAAFLDLVRLGNAEQARGQSLGDFLGSSAVDRNILIAHLREHGVVRNFGTVLRNQFQEQEDVEVSAVLAPDAEQPCYGFTVRRMVRRLDNAVAGAPQLGRSVEQLAQLIGRVPMKNLVQETVDLVERLCIEAALELTGNNRASAAQVLGLSRQSLYSKLHRFDIGHPDAD